MIETSNAPRLTRYTGHDLASLCALKVNKTAMVPAPTV